MWALQRFHIGETRAEQVRAEVSARVAELRKIDGMIRGLEEAGRGGTSREDYSGEPSAAGSEGLS